MLPNSSKNAPCQLLLWGYYANPFWNQFSMRLRRKLKNFLEDVVIDLITKES